MGPKFLLRLLPLFILLAVLSGCAPVIVGTAATGMMVSHDRRAVGDSVEDVNLEFKVTNLIYKDKELSDHTHITATSYNRWVLLTGQAESPALRGRIVRKVKELDRVARVIDEIELAPASSISERTQDSYTTSKVKMNLFSIEIAGFDPTRVKVVTERGTVFLMGLLTPSEQEAVVNTVRYISEVKRVVKVFETIQ